MAESFKVTPWEVSGLSGETYEKLIKKFGVKKIDGPLIQKILNTAGSLHPFISLNLFYAERDLGELLDDYRKGNKFYLYTGRGPSGKMHIGHLMPFIFTKWLQEAYGVDLVIQLTDDEKYLVKNLSRKEIDGYVEDNILDILSLGFDPKHTHILVDSKQSGLMYNYAVDVAKHITVSTIKAVFGVKDSDNIGKMFFPSMQIVPSFIIPALTGRKMRCLIPYAIDQDPYFRVARDVIPKLGYYKPSAIISKFLPSLQGDSGKMSSSVESSAIFLSDDDKTVRRKLMKYAFSGGRDTVEEQRKHGANPDIDFAFNAYMMFEADAKKVRQVYDDYKSGRMLSGEMKELAAAKISEKLADMRAMKERIKGNLAPYMFDPSKFSQ